MRLWILLPAIILSHSATGHTKDLLLDQPSRLPRAISGTRSNISETSGLQGIDDFRLLAGGEITNVSWQGLLPHFGFLLLSTSP